MTEFSILFADRDGNTKNNGKLVGEEILKITKQINNPALEYHNEKKIIRDSVTSILSKSLDNKL